LLYPKREGATLLSISDRELKHQIKSGAIGALRERGCNLTGSALPGEPTNVAKEVKALW
jgi:hypothetical protein